MNTWAAVFSQSPANNATYLGENLPAQIWQWPSGTWFQNRVRYLRKQHQLQAAQPRSARAR